MMKHEFRRPENWFDELQRIAKLHNNASSVRDYEGWTADWETESPEDVYYAEFPEHKLMVDCQVIGPKGEK